MYLTTDAVGVTTDLTFVLIINDKVNLTIDHMVHLTIDFTLVFVISDIVHIRIYVSLALIIYDTDASKGLLHSSKCPDFELHVTHNNLSFQREKNVKVYEY